LAVTVVEFPRDAVSEMESVTPILVDASTTTMLALALKLDVYEKETVPEI